jgi:hypothetical protein
MIPTFEKYSEYFKSIDVRIYSNSFKLLEILTAANLLSERPGALLSTQDSNLAKSSRSKASPCALVSGA